MKPGRKNYGRLKRSEWRGNIIRLILFISLCISQVERCVPTGTSTSSVLIRIYSLELHVKWSLSFGKSPPHPCDIKKWVNVSSIVFNFPTQKTHGSHPPHAVIGQLCGCDWHCHFVFSSLMLSLLPSYLKDVYSGCFAPCFPGETTRKYILKALFVTDVSLLC